MAATQRLGAGGKNGSGVLEEMCVEESARSKLFHAALLHSSAPMTAKTSVARKATAGQ